MCEPPRYPPIKSELSDARRASELLAKLMEDKMDLSSVNPIVLRLFLCAHWDKVTKLAHRIHDDDK